MKGGKNLTDRGRVETVRLSKKITFNNNEISIATIEIDHINHGLNSKTKKLKASKRSDFTIKDIEKFLQLLDGELIVPNSYKGNRSQFNIRINCPVAGKFYGKEFIMIFDTDYYKTNEIYTITLYPGW